MMNGLRILQAEQPQAEHRRLSLDRLVAFSDPRAGGQDWPEHELCFVVRGADGTVAGGLWGRFYYDWLFIELIFLPENRRGEGLGSALLAMAEDQAWRWGAAGVWLDTFSFQARGFYEAKGYAVFGEIAAYPGSHSRFFLNKRLGRAPPVAPHPEVEAVPQPHPSLREAIEEPLSRFNDLQLGGGPWPDEELALPVLEGDGAIAGGLWGRSYYGWLFVDLLFVPEGLRGQGLGTELLRRAEAAAKARGCIGIWLDTFSFQAPDFYPKHGYRTFGRIAHYPAPHDRLFFSKRLQDIAGALVTPS